MNGHRVVVTGIGAITPIGIGVEGLWGGILEARSGVRRLERFDASSFTSQVAAEVVDFDPAMVLESKQVKRLDRFAQFAVACARQAVADAGLDLEAVDRDRVGVFIGTALGGAAFAKEQARIFLREGIRRVRPTLAVSVFGGAASCNIAMDLGLRGPTSANSDSCASGAIAIGEAMRLVRGGEVDLMLAGGVEVPLTPLIFGAFDLLRAMSARFNHDPARASRPFDRHRDGFVMAEGAAILVLERLEHALARHARIYGEVLGYGAHASSTPLNDATETRAIKEVFGPHAYRAPVSGTKSMHGHPLEAAGAVEAAICLLTLFQDYVPPTINLEEPDAECDPDYVPNRGRFTRVHYVLNNSFRFGGINACLVFGRFPSPGRESQ
ncbi:MAG: beta-ketoacyl-[acyl-carrier-protein] synthase II [Armatimonadetes bacterium]|nr:beta-ketoacyl-[acyl-carrier-protein] synthase II [Armatimonadota bacterium]MDW8154421.1 beta-ketoacyl synthase N-terminal-like domain-containing protein [Armatimonadota bacterium]